ncbi:MAG: GNAT family N-acetyltransferase [Rheinheimera sp.]|uniref:GNAT family N-acetyltransferase n=1 Tax=Arsukibacterium sp. UBA3155 TaxID=1946058 RepID=UPI000C898AC1|nr:GNAT family N-acetyltransferase [Arsukibacterium sp. UBA3155]MAD77454.1 GNAT family N-acetyltransferase [Rheinheimera sp.]
MSLICETARLIIRRFTLEDADFIVQLLNDESFIRYIADKQVRSVADAENYLTNGPLASYNSHGFGLNMVLLKHADSGVDAERATPIGMCGLLKRAELSHPDLGFAFLPECCGKGYAREAATATLSQAIETHGLHTVLAVTKPDNLRSSALLLKLGFAFKHGITLYGAENKLYQYLAP